MGHLLHHLIDVDSAKRIASENLRIKLGEERIDLENSTGRVLTRDIFSPINSPPFSRSVKDGIAVQAEDVRDASETSPVKLKITGSIDIGTSPAISGARGTCIKIPTGGVMPEGTDAVVMVEYVREEPGFVYVVRSVSKGENVALAGSDTPMGELLMRKGTKVSPREIAVLATLGVSALWVKRRLRVGVLSTGNELVPPGEELQPGKIYESNGRTIKSLIENEGPAFEVKFYGTLPDDEVEIKKGIDACIDENDITVISGSTSAGEKDVVYRVLGSYSPGTLFHGVMIKPGKPTLLSVKGEKPIIGLPGFPVSAMMTFLTIYFPFILRSAGLSSSEHFIECKLATKINLEMGKLNLIPVSVVHRDTEVAFPIYGGSGSITRILRADGYVSLDGNARNIEPGENLTVRLFGPDTNSKTPVLVGEGSDLLDAIASQSGERLRIIKTGHFNAIQSFLNGYSDVAGIILPEGAQDELKEIFSGNVEEISILGVRENEIGIVSSTLGGKEISTLTQIADLGLDLAVTSRADGATRVTDGILMKAGLADESLSKHRVEVGDFNSVAFSVSQGYYPAGICDRISAERYDLRFSPAGTFNYVILCRNENKRKMSFIADLLESISVPQGTSDPTDLST